MNRMDIVPELVKTSAAPDAAQVESLYSVASAGPPLSEPRSVAQLYARLYHRLLLPDTLIASASDGDLVGICYGHPWKWANQTDAWSQQLADRLGSEAAQSLDGALAVRLLAVHPKHQRGGLGKGLLRMVCEASSSSSMWLETTDIDSPARRLYASTGWKPIGYGPDAPDGRPGLVLQLSRPR